MADRTDGDTSDPGVALPPDLVAPDYAGHCLTGVAGSVRRLFGQTAERVLPAGVFPEGAFDCVVLVIVDALGAEQVAFHRGKVAAMDRVLARGALSTLTSVLPSTTTAALTSLLTGLTPQEHGMLGHTLYLREFGLVADMLRFHPAWLPGHGGLVRDDTGLRDLFPARTLFEDLVAAGVHVQAFMQERFVATALSDIHLAGAERMPFVTASDLCVGLRRAVQAGPRPRFISAYWHAIDGLAHLYGPGSPEEAAELASFFALLGSELLDALPGESRRGVLVLVTADHGQVLAHPDEALRLNDHPDLAAALLLPPTGDRRATYLYPRTGMQEQVRREMGQFADRFFLLDSQEALRAGLFGIGVPMPETSLRIGDLLLLARGGATFAGLEKSPPAHPLRGRHGGATRAEMQVPFLTLHDW